MVGTPGASLEAVLPSCHVSTLVDFSEKGSVTFHLCVSVDPVNAAPTTSTRVFYISVGVCCAVIFLVAIILAVLHLHSMKRIELDDRYVFKVFQAIFCDRTPRLVGVLASKLVFCSGLQFLPSVSACSSDYLCRVVLHAVLQKGSSCRCSAGYGLETCGHQVFARRVAWMMYPSGWLQN